MAYRTHLRRAQLHFVGIGGAGMSGLPLGGAVAGCRGERLGPRRVVLGSGPARLVVKRRGRVVLRARLGSKRRKVLKGSRLAAGQPRGAPGRPRGLRAPPPPLPGEDDEANEDADA